MSSEKGEMYSMSWSIETQIPVVYQTSCREATSISALGQCLAATLAYCHSFFFCEKGYLGSENVKLIIASCITVRLESLRFTHKQEFSDICNICHNVKFIQI